MNDRLGRPLRNLRVSVTDRCNLRCEYCMPVDDYQWLPREDVLRFEETSALVDVFLSLGVDKVRLTGGEPLLRRDAPALVRMLSQSGIARPRATTNGVLLATRSTLPSRRGPWPHHGQPRHSPSRALRKSLTRFDQLEAVRAGIGGVSAYGELEIDTVVIRGVNDDELRDLIEFGRSVNAEVRSSSIWMSAAPALVAGARRVSRRHPGRR
jgi:cyclic pyranopterin phosphate synthase